MAKTDKELADAVVALGIGTYIDNDDALLRRYHYHEFHDPESFVRDWRVGGACLEQWPTIINVEHLDMTLDEMLRDPRAIIDAYVEALEADK